MKTNFFYRNLLLLSLLLALLAIDACKTTTDPVVTSGASISTIACASATFSTTAVSGATYTGTATVPYTGGNGVAYGAGTAVGSTGVTGLNAILQAGTLASGAGNLTYSINGTPSSSGIAAFALSFGGQTCTLSLAVGGTSSGTVTANSSAVTTALSVTASANATCNAQTGLAKVVCLTEAFKATLTATQLATTQLTYSKANAQKWSNLPASLSSRIGISLGSLNSTQLAAFRDLMVAVLTTGGLDEGYDEMLGNMVADDYLATIGGGSGYGAANFYIAVLGTPSTTGLWSILFTGHHYTQPFTFNAGAVTGVTPAFRAVEPAAVVTGANRSYQPIEQERAAFAAMLTGLSSTEQTTAKLSSTFSDVVLGPGKDGQFPAIKAGLRVGDLSAAKQALVLNAIKLYVSDLDANTATASTILAKYTSDLANTYIAYSGTTAVASQNDYVRIDGPGVWIEFSYQGGVIVRNTPHPHSVWRDHTGDYGGN
ncbi:DUF3500 domain-containing protein [Fibrella aquatilis]|uniref:DUF3500 domain-containing protein n=1 Tax=Fibrella aquatilis TaxID=2817059 RepID=A0A939G2R0_9BACT|nr:DUF3500 domain-containing protein [Fibrella aquatilis]MBO0930811.1 DUF3500 domain-containing protein [Fibrella aquatilis]